MSLNKKIYLVGGAVRDKLMGIPICDKDYVAVGFSEDEFSHLPKVGKEFPVYLQADGTELALARVEQKVALGYNGFTTRTKNVTLEEDLARRDLTINSIAYDESTNTYIDPYNGQQDIKNKLLKHTSKAFCEDPLRVLRLARFRAKFGSSWRIDESTKHLVSTMRSELASLQPDRVYKEIDKASNYKEFHLLFETLAQLDVLENIFPCMGELYKKDKKAFFIATDLMKSLYIHSLALKLSAIYYFVYKDSIDTIKSITDIKLPKKIETNIVTLLKKHAVLLELDSKDDVFIEMFFRDCRKDKKHLEEILLFNKTLFAISKKHHYSLTKELNSNALLGICDEISSYSPKIWLKSFITKPSNSKISSHIQDYNLQVINKYKQLYKKKLFVK